jgi:uncharacterized cupredoxin-like copper-binding protein
MLKTLQATALVALALGSVGAFAHGEDAHAKQHKFQASAVEDTDFGREGDPSKVSRTVRVDMADTMRFTPSHLAIKRGETIRFVVRNQGKQLHEMVLGTVDALKAHAELMRKFPEMEHADANMAHVKPGATGEIVWQFTQAGEFQFACLQPGHFDAGMVGKVIVK